MLPDNDRACVQRLFSNFVFLLTRPTVAHTLLSRVGSTASKLFQTSLGLTGICDAEGSNIYSDNLHIFVYVI